MAKIEQNYGNLKRIKTFTKELEGKTIIQYNDPDNGWHEKILLRFSDESFVIFDQKGCDWCGTKITIDSGDLDEKAMHDFGFIEDEEYNKILAMNKKEYLEKVRTRELEEYRKLAEKYGPLENLIDLKQDSGKVE